MVSIAKDNLARRLVRIYVRVVIVLRSEVPADPVDDLDPTINSNGAPQLMTIA